MGVADHQLRGDHDRFQFRCPARDATVRRFPHPLDRHPHAGEWQPSWCGFPFRPATRITAAPLFVRSAFFRWRIPLVQIVEVFPTRNPLTPPLCRSTDFEINYQRPDGRPWWVMISPQDQARFLDDLAVAADSDGSQIGWRVLRDRQWRAAPQIHGNRKWAGELKVKVNVAGITA